LGAFKIIVGDVEDVLPKLEGPFDAVACDPPYGLSFMGKAWDRGVPGEPIWRLVLELLRPGAFVAAFGGTRTYHRLACAIEDAGFEVRDCLSWLYASGFPKSLDVSKAIDKAAGVERAVIGSRRTSQPTGNAYAQDEWTKARRQAHDVDYTAPATGAARTWDGYGTALKPAWEPCILAMKPLDGTFAANVLEHGTGAINVEGCRIGTEGGTAKGTFPREPSQGVYGNGINGACEILDIGKGRWPANVALDEDAAAMLDEQSGKLTSGANPTRRGSDKFREAYGDFRGQRECVAHRGADSGGASRFFYVAKVATAERNAGLEAGDPCRHPTLKPVKLAEWIAKLLLPPPREDGSPRRLLVPFSGAGSEVAGALRAGWDEVVGIERSEEYAAWSRKRIPALERLTFEAAARATAYLPGQALLFDA
jgi:hypothetical protein